MEKLRIDKYLWSIRMFKTRTLAAAACQGGKIKCRGESVKASKPVLTGDKYEIKKDEKILIEVTGLLHRRVQYEEALKYYIDLTPEKENKKIQSSAFYFDTGKRKSRQGRPTKKEQRKLNDLLNH